MLRMEKAFKNNLMDSLRMEKFIWKKRFSFRLILIVLLMMIKIYSIVFTCIKKASTKKSNN